MLWCELRLIFKTSSVTPDFFYTFLSFSAYSQSLKKKPVRGKFLGANVLKRLRIALKSKMTIEKTISKIQLCACLSLEQVPALGGTRLKLSFYYRIRVYEIAFEFTLFVPMEKLPMVDDRNKIWFTWLFSH